MVEPSDRPAASSFHGDREPEVSVRTVRLEELLAILRRHVRLVVGVVLATVAAAGVVAYVTGPAYRAVSVIRMSDPRRALTGGVVLDPARADERFSDPLLSQAELLTSRAVAGAVVDSMPALRMVTTRDLPLSFLGEVAVPAAAGPVSLQIAFGRDSFVVRGTSGQWSAPYGSAVESHDIRFAVLHRTVARAEPRGRDQRPAGAPPGQAPPQHRYRGRDLFGTGPVCRTARLKPGGRPLQERERRRRATAVHTTPRVPRVPTQGQRFAPGRRAAGGHGVSPARRHLRVAGGVGA